MKVKYCVLLIIVFGACTKPYVANIKGQSVGFLVVEGYINVSGTTTIHMSRSTGLDSPQYIPELGAQLVIESNNGGSIPLTEAGNGVYSVDGLNLDPTSQYRLQILTAGKEYLSDLSTVNITPPIDSVNWTANSSGVNIFVSTHNDLVQPGYYQWSFNETWEYNSGYSSDLEYQNSELIARPLQDLIYTCWRTDSSTNIAISNTEKLSSNVVYQYPLTQIPFDNTNKMTVKYSILVKQTSLSKDWYEWVQKIQRNTEQLGSIFDAQPSETGGNIHCTTDPTEMVIGFIGTTTETEQRIFIRRSQLPFARIYTGYESCTLNTSGLDPASLASEFSTGFYIPVQLVYANGIAVGVTSSSPDCVDCRVQGGTLTKPDFWQ
ncbi:MAG TPA: DUF4249 domain-containing protein [Puia sp.]|jgi:hypothetical protein|nr:DUF4249 domain-containing protein [Puia sp.]